MLQNSAFAGTLFLVGIFVSSTLFGIAAIVGTSASTAAAYLLGADRAQVRAGLYGFNGALVAIALAYFLKSEPIMWAYVVLAAAASSAVMAALSSLLGNGRPALTAPFILVTLAFVLAVAHFGALHTTGRLPTAALPRSATAIVGVVDARTIIEGFFKGVAEIFLQDNAITGAIFLLGLCVGSPLAGAAAAVGALIGLSIGWVLGAPEQAIRLGLYGFNPALTAIALASVFLVRSRAALIYSLIAAVVTAVLFASVSAALLPIGMPALTLPFVLATWGFLFAAPSFKAVTLRS